MNKQIYHLSYKNINPLVIEAVRKAIIDKRIFKTDFKERCDILNDLLNDLCILYKIPKEKKPILIVDIETDGYFNSQYNLIALNYNLSLITFLHEFKHFLQYHFKKVTIKTKEDYEREENIARGYSLSLFYLASPKHFNRAIEKGLIFHEKIQ